MEPNQQQPTIANPNQPSVVATSPQSPGMSSDTKIVIVVLCLLFFWPAGLILMWAWMKTWPTWVKVLISLPLLLMVLGVLAAIILIDVNPYKQIQRAQQNSMMERQAPTQTMMVYPSMMATSSALPHMMMATNGATLRTVTPGSVVNTR